MKRILSILAAMVLLPAALRADGGVVVLKQEQGPYMITVFAQPVPPRAGPVDLSIMVQDKATQDPVLDAAVTVHLLHVGKEGDPDWVPPCCRLEGGKDVQALKADRAQAQNKLLYAVWTPLPKVGPWELRVAVDGRLGQAEAVGTLEVLPASPPWSAYWPYFSVPLLGGVFLGINGWARRQRKKQSFEKQI